MSTTRRLSLVLLTISWFVALGCEGDVLGPGTQSNGSEGSKPSSGTALWISLSGRVTSFDTGEPVEGVRVTVYRILSADRPNTAMTTSETDEHGRYVLNFSHRCDGTWYGLKVRKDGSPNLFPRTASKRIWPLPDNLCSRTRWVIDIQVVGLVS
jgi:hypothetical protein